MMKKFNLSDASLIRFDDEKYLNAKHDIENSLLNKYIDEVAR